MIRPPSHTAALAAIEYGSITRGRRSQIEAAQSLGMTYARLMRRIVLAQAFIRMLSGILNQFNSIFE